jgi:hypothetical protein
MAAAALEIMGTTVEEFAPQVSYLNRLECLTKSLKDLCGFLPRRLLT